MPTSPQPKPRHPAPAPGHGAPMAAAAVWARALRSRCARWGVIAPPYAWMALFFAVPFAIVLERCSDEEGFDWDERVWASWQEYSVAVL